MDTSLGWKVLLLQEFTACNDTRRFESSAGHQVFFTAPTEGSRACCIVIHVSIVHRIVSNSVTYRDRGVAVALHWEGWNLFLLSYHLSPFYSRVEYIAQLDDLRDFCHCPTPVSYTHLTLPTNREV